MNHRYTLLPVLTLLVGLLAISMPSVVAYVSPQPSWCGVGRVPASGAAQPLFGMKTTYSLGLGKNQPVAQLLQQGEDGSYAVLDDDATISTPATTTTTAAPAVVDDAIRHWVEYESVRQYPAPYANAASKVLHSTSFPVVAASSDTQTTPKKKTARDIIPSRLAGDDVLRIEHRQPYHHRDAAVTGPGLEDGTAVTATATSPPSPVFGIVQTPMRNIDLNTAWVELLIYEQQTKFAKVATK